MQLEPMFLDSLERFFAPKLEQIVERALYLLERNHPDVCKSLEGKNLESLQDVPKDLFSVLISEQQQEKKDEVLIEFGEKLVDLDVPMDVVEAMQKVLWKSAGSYLEDRWTPSLASKTSDFLSSCVSKVKVGLGKLEDLDHMESLEKVSETELNQASEPEVSTEDVVEVSQPESAPLSEQVDSSHSESGEVETPSVEQVESGHSESGEVETPSVELPMTEKSSENNTGSTLDSIPVDGWQEMVKQAAEVKAREVVENYWNECFSGAVQEEIKKLAKSR